jgi:hypothetical protein
VVVSVLVWVSVLGGSLIVRVSVLGGSLIVWVSVLGGSLIVSVLVCVRQSVCVENTVRAEH